MRKFLLVALCVWVSVTLANAQTYSRVKQHVREYDGVAGQVEKLLPYLPTNYVAYSSDVDAVASNAAALVAGVESNLTAHATDTAQVASPRPRRPRRKT